MLLKKRSRPGRVFETEGFYTERPVFTLLDQLELEHFRLSNNLTTTERDTLLSQIHVPTLLVDPTHSIYPRSHTEEAVRQKIEKQTNKQCFQCKKNIKIFQNNIQCCYCHHNFCSGCVKSNLTTIPEYCWSKPSTVCNDCFECIQQQKAYIPSILSLIRKAKPSAKLRRSVRFLASVQRSAPSRSLTRFSRTKINAPLSDYPAAGLLHSVVSPLNTPYPHFPYSPSNSQHTKILPRPRCCWFHQAWYIHKHTGLLLKE